MVPNDASVANSALNVTSSCTTAEIRDKSAEFHCKMFTERKVFDKTALQYSFNYAHGIWMSRKPLILIFTLIATRLEVPNFIFPIGSSFFVQIEFFHFCCQEQKKLHQSLNSSWVKNSSMSSLVLPANKDMIDQCVEPKKGLDDAHFGGNSLLGNKKKGCSKLFIQNQKPLFALGPKTFQMKDTNF